MNKSIAASPDKLTIKSDLAGFVLLDKICNVCKDAIEGAILLPDNAPRFFAIEAMAQLGGMHARFTYDFDLHVFLLKIECLRFSVENTENGNYRLRAILRAGSDRAFSYRIRMRTSHGSHAAEGIFCFAALPYDCLFKEEKLINHYKELFACLKKGTNNAC